MKIVRSILAIVLGVILAAKVVVVGELLSTVLYKPADMSIEEFAKMMQDPEKTQQAGEFIKGLPVMAMVIVVAAWTLGAFVGGGAAAWIAGWARCWHAG